MKEKTPAQKVMDDAFAKAHNWEKKTDSDTITALRGDEKKKDHGKLMWDLLPLSLIRPVVEVLTFGAKKYSPNSWQLVENAKDRYFAAMMRHIEAYQSGELIDPESGLSHMAHIQCNAMFLQHFTKDCK